MFPSRAEHVQALRDALHNANRENTRPTAALLGSAIARISWATQDDPQVRLALAVMRTASLELLEELTRNKEPEKARQAAFQALDALAVRLEGPGDVTPPPQEQPAQPSVERKVVPWPWRKTRRA